MGPRPATAGDLPRQAPRRRDAHYVEEAFGSCGLSLFPAAPGDLDTACSCPDWANPCKHVAAVYWLLAEAFDTDPFLIFAWRGRGKASCSRACGPAAAARGPRRPRRPTTRVRPRSAVVADALLRQLDPPEITVRGVPVDDVLAGASRTLADREDR